MKNLKKIILIATIILVILVFILMGLIKSVNKDKEAEGFEEKEEHNEDVPIQNAQVEMVSDMSEYYTIKNIVDKYFNFINASNATTKSLEIDNIENATEYVNEYKQNAIKGLNDILNKEYTLENEENNFSKYENKTFRLNKVYYLSKTAMRNVYYLYITLDYAKDMNLIILKDSLSNAFSIINDDYIEKNKWTENDLSNIKFDDDIYPNDNNTYEYVYVTDSMKAASYLEDFKEIAQTYPKMAYEMIDEEYKNTKNLTLNEFNERIKNSGDFTLASYSLVKDGDNNIYVCKADNAQVYIFKEKNIMDYTVQLDDYTLKNSFIEQEYNKETNQNRAKINVGKFFEMINNQDYDRAYDLLDETFKQRNFATVNDFKNYVIKEMYKCSYVNYKTYSNDISEIHSVNVSITDALAENVSETKNFTFVMKLLDNTDFVMSFSKD